MRLYRRKHIKDNNDLLYHNLPTRCFRNGVRAEELYRVRPCSVKTMFLKTSSVNVDGPILWYLFALHVQIVQISLCFLSHGAHRIPSIRVHNTLNDSSERNKEQVVSDCQRSEPEAICTDNYIYFSTQQTRRTWPAMLEQEYVRAEEKKGSHLIPNGSRSFATKTRRSITVFSLPAILNYCLPCIVARATGVRVIDMAAPRT